MSGIVDEVREHPAAKQMREEFNAKYGNCADVMRAVLAYFNTRTEYNESWNFDREMPTTAADVDACEAAIIDAVRSQQNALPRWIPVSERLPDEECRHVLVFTAINLCIFTAYLENGYWLCAMDHKLLHGHVGAVTHWMPLDALYASLPKPPGEAP